MNNSNQQGFTILAVIFLLSLLGLVSVWSWQSLHHATRMSLQSHHSTLGRLRAHSAAIRTLRSYTAVSKGVNCYEAANSTGKATFRRSLCLVAPRIPVPLLSSLFLNPSNCAAQSQQTTLHSPLAMSLTPSSLVSMQTCQKIQSQFQQAHIAVYGNLSLKDGLSLPSSAGANFVPYSILSASGFLEVGGKLEVSGPSLVYAGGDISIAELTSLSQNHMPVMILSSSGSVIVRKASENTTLEAYAAQGLYLPAGKTNKQGILNISPIEKFLVGIH